MSNKSRCTEVDKGKSEDAKKVTLGDEVATASTVAQSHAAEVEDIIQDITKSKIMEVIVDSADKWQSAATIVTQHKISRPDGTTLTFPLKGIPSAMYYKIMRETRPMDAPEKEEVQVDRRGNPVKGLPTLKVADMKDPAYLANLEEMGNKKMTLVIDAALTFDIPGKTWQEKHEWLQDRLPGDVMNLYSTIDRFLFNLSEKFGDYL